MRVRLPAASAACIASALMICAMPAFAADYPVLRGSASPSLPPPPVIADAPAIDWNGLYIGAYGAANMTNTRGRDAITPWINGNFGAAYGTLAGSRLDIGNRNTRSTGYGMFAGYNVASDDALIGFEADFGWLNSRSNVVGVLNNIPAGVAPATIQINSALAQTRLDQITSIRARAGLIYGNIMPYVTGGFAWAYGTQRDSADVTVLPVQAGVPTTFTTSRNVLYSGYTVGAGLEARFGGLLLRGEYLYTVLESSRGGANNRIDLNQARLGAGVAF